MRWIAIAFLVGLASPLFAQDKPIDVPIGSDKFRLIGKLHEPLGTILTLQGTIVVSHYKGEDGGPKMLVQRINGRATQEIILIRIFEGWKDIGVDLPTPKSGNTFEIKGYETGGFDGVPFDAIKHLRLTPQVRGHGFRHQFVYHEAKKIDPIGWVPADFLGREALLEGKAVSEDKKAFIAGNDWRMEVDSKAGWPVDFEGKKVEGFGTIRKTEISKTYKLEKGETRLVKLEDQLGRQVALRGTAWSMNGFWWFSYRGTQMYALGMEDLPGWKVECHGESILISGVLEKTMLPAIDQITTKTERDWKSYFVIRKPSWKKIDALLIPEMGKVD